MTQKEVFDDLREALGYEFGLQSDETIDKITEGSWMRVKYQLKDLIRELCRVLKIKG